MLKVNASTNVDEVTLQLRNLADELPDALADDFAQDALNILTEIPRNYIPANHRRAPGQKPDSRAMGRLWSGWGVRRRVFTTNPESTIDDNIAEMHRHGDDIEIEVGTRIRYAGYVNVGAPTDQNRYPYLFTERGEDLIEYELNKALEYYMDDLIDEERISVGSSIRARGRDRDELGRFLPYI